MLVYILALPYFLFMYYLFRRGHSWSKACTGFAARKGFKYTLAAVFIIMALSPAIAFFLPTGDLRHVSNIVANFHLGIMIYLGGLVVISDLIKIILKKTGVLKEETLKSRAVFATVGGMIIILVVVLCIYGAIHSKDIILTERTAIVHKEMPSATARDSQSRNNGNDIDDSDSDDENENENEKDDEMTIAIVADTHLAYNSGLKQVKTIVKYINEMDADLVCMPGDFFTNVYDDVREPEKIIAEFRKIKSKYGVYGCWGNHDVDEPILAGFTFSGKSKHPKHDPRMVKFLKGSNIKILEDEYELVDNKFYVAGRLDAEKPGIDKERQPLNKVLEGIDKSKPIIMIDHEPRELGQTSERGVDLDISGHTHDGQFFPLNLTQHFIWPNPYGVQLYDRKGSAIDDSKAEKGEYGDPQTTKQDTMTSIVTSGAGVYGPNLRIGTSSEVVKLEVAFKEIDDSKDDSDNDDN